MSSNPKLKNKMGQFTKQLDERRNAFTEEYSSKLEFIGRDVFRFDTDERKFMCIMSRKMLIVLEAILHKNTMPLLGNEASYYDYLVMVNMPFLKDIIEQGASIRFPWFDTYESVDVCCGDIIIEKHELKEFIQDLIDWA